MATASLMGMPLELLVHLIAKYLPTKDLGALRLTNRYLEKALFDTFAKEFFVKKQFMLTTPSLQTLVNISKHDALSVTLTHCIIGLESYEHTFLPPLASETQKTAFRDGFADQFALLNSGRGQQLLTEAFRRLPNLEIIGIRDYEATNRVRDGITWRSYGASTVFQQTSCNLRTGSSQFASKAFLLLMQAVVDADREIRCVETILRTNNTGLNDLAFFLPPPNPKMDRVLCGLQQLLLTINNNAEIQYGIPDSSTLMESFLVRARSLKHVRLNFQQYGLDHAGTLQRLTRTPNILPNLQRLDLGMLSVEPEILVDFVFKFSATVRHVSLWKVDIRYDTGSRWKDAEDRFNPWPRIFQDVSSAANLTGMSVGCISQRIDPGGGCAHLRLSSKISKEYLGNMKVWLPQLLNELEVQWPQRPPQDVDSSSGDEDLYVTNADVDEDDASDDED